jgi:hypothetical protein
MQVFSNQAFIVNGGASTNVNVIIDTAGVATLGTDLPVPASGFFTGFLSTGKVFYSAAASGSSSYYQYGISAGSAVLEKTFDNVTSTTVITATVPASAAYSRPLSGPPQSGSNDSPMLRTSAGKIAPASASVLPFTVSIDGTNQPKLQQSANPFTAFNDAISDAVAWGMPSIQSATSTTVQLRKVTLA